MGFLTRSTLAAHIGRENNLNAVRLGMSLLVVFAHSFALSLGLEHTPRFTIACGEVAVNIFFFISGLLITASWLRSKNMNDYLRKRILRIYPGFIVALLFSIVVMTAANPTKASPLFSWLGIKSIIWGCFTLSFMSTAGDAVFPANPFPGHANGSLWTIPVEFQCYLLVAIIGLFCLFKRRWLILGLFVYSYLLLCKGLWLGWDVTHLDRRFLVYFSAGMCAWLWRDKILYHWSIILVLLGLILTFLVAKLPLSLIEPLTLMYLALWIGYAKPFNFIRWCDKTDLSYGVYLYAFPIQQLIATTAYGRNPWRMMVAAIPLSLLAAFASWHLVEKRFLRMKSSRFLDHDPVETMPAVRVTNKEAQLEQAF
jgi:peptidoglycan/LPS O-acetylase OafA/YrhL